MFDMRAQACTTSVRGANLPPARCGYRRFPLRLRGPGNIDEICDKRIIIEDVDGCNIATVDSGVWSFMGEKPRRDRTIDVGKQNSVPLHRSIREDEGDRREAKYETCFAVTESGQGQAQAKR